MTTTSGSAVIRGTAVEYTARAGTTMLRAADGSEACSMFSVAYTRTDAGEATRRPVIYAFDGGPGTASTTMHLGLLGPRRVDLGEGAFDARGPQPIVDNAAAVLDVADMVIIDAPGTGFSRAAGPDRRRFSGYTADIDIMSQFIAEHLARSGRWGSPVVILGESYGGARAAGLSFVLEDRYGLYPAGVVLLVPVLSSQALSFTDGNDLPYPLYLPTLAALAHHHGRAGHGVELDEWIAEAERFALDEYPSALLRGASLPAARHDAVAARLAELTGLDPAWVRSCDLRIRDQRFFKELLRDRRRVLSRADGRTTGLDRDAAGEEPDHDPYTAFIRRAMNAAANHYIRGELGFQTPLDYRFYDRSLLPWSWADVAENQFAFPVEALRLAMAKHPGMRVLVASGIYDGSVPFLSVENTLDRALREPELRAAVTRRRYRTGHMLYLEEPARTQLGDDLADFLRTTAAGGGAASLPRDA